MLIWTCLLFIFTFNSDFKGLLVDRKVRFQFEIIPNLSHVFYFYSLNTIGSFTVLQKIGHFFFFFVLAYLLFRVYSNLKPTFVIGMGYAFLTEFVQAFFKREARVQDVMVDVMGVLAFIILYVVIKDLRRLLKRDKDARVI
nr:VanZ family protein [Metabacillus lacus]